MKEFADKKNKTSSSDVEKNDWRIPVDALYDFVHESVVDEDGMFKFKEEGSTILDRHGNHTHLRATERAVEYEF